ncbi:hypothetical protein BKA70DRAFT_1522052 [Coprinopsis sp. MPI-PUGE-AT-0042]|nr:hypothetical protein BKA70DRAFT_1522052 [Coprinopsis sp. MPI-PUGE-AT-0042]
MVEMRRAFLSFPIHPPQSSPHPTCCHLETGNSKICRKFLEKSLTLRMFSALLNVGLVLTCSSSSSLFLSSSRLLCLSPLLSLVAILAYAASSIPNSSPPTPKPTPPINPLKRKEPPSDDADPRDGPPPPKALSTSKPLVGCSTASPRPRPAVLPTSASPDAEGEQDVEDGEGENDEDEIDDEVVEAKAKNAAGGSELPEEYVNNQVVCQNCGLQINIRDAESGDFTVKMWEAHRAECCPPSSTSRRLATNSDPSQTRSMAFKPESKGSTSIIYTPESTAQSLSHPTTKRRRAKRTEEERIEYLRRDQYVAQFEAYRVLCASCQKWIRLRPNSTFCSIPWDAHRKSCLAKKLSRNSKNAYALEERNNLFSQDPDIRKFDAERLLYATNGFPSRPMTIPMPCRNGFTTGLAAKSLLARAPPPPPSSSAGMNTHGGDRPSSSGRPMKDIPRAPPPSGTQIAALTSVVNLASAIGSRGQQQHPPPSPRHPSHGGPLPGRGVANGNGNGAMNGGAGGREQHRGSMTSMSSRERESPFVGQRVMGSLHARDGPSNGGPSNGHGPPHGPHAGGSHRGQHPHHPHQPGHPLNSSQHASGRHGEQGERTGHGERGQDRGPPSPPFHDLTPSTYPPLHESRRRNAEQRADTLRRDHLIGEVEANRVFCRLCSKWVQLRQDSSFCAYPWLQHRAKCIARHQRRAQKIADLNALNMGSSTSLVGKPHLHRSASHPHLTHGVDRRLNPGHGNAHPHARRAGEMEMEEDELMSDSDEDGGGSMDEGDGRVGLRRNGHALLHEEYMQLAQRQGAHHHLPPHLIAPSSSAHRVPGPGPGHATSRGGSRVVQNGPGPSVIGRSSEPNPRSNGTPRMAGPSTRPGASSTPASSDGHAHAQASTNGNGNGVDGIKKPWKFPPPPPGHPRHNPQTYAAYVAAYGPPHASYGPGVGCRRDPPPSSTAHGQNGAAAGSSTGVMRRPREAPHQHALRSGTAKNGMGKNVQGDGAEEDQDGDMEGDDEEEDVDAEGEPEVIDVDADAEVEATSSRRGDHRLVKRESDDEEVGFDTGRERNTNPMQRDGDAEREGEEDGDEEGGDFEEELSYPVYDNPLFHGQATPAAIYRMQAAQPTFHRRPSSSSGHGYANGGEQGGYARYVGAGGYAGTAGNGHSMRRAAVPPPSMAMPGAGGALGRPYPVGLADLDSPAGRKQFIVSSIQHLFSTTYESTDELTVSTLLAYVNSAMPVDKHEDFDTAEIVKYLAQLKERGRVVFMGDVVRPGRD